jgi:hypothetical protein
MHLLVNKLINNNGWNNRNGAVHMHGMYMCVMNTNEWYTLHHFDMPYEHES